MKRFTNYVGRTERPARPKAPSTLSGYWSNPATWGGFPPLQNETVIIPVGQTYILDCETPNLATLDIRGSLIVDSNSDARINAVKVSIAPTGTLQCGSESVKHKKSFIIDLGGTVSKTNRYVADVDSSTGAGNGKVSRLSALPGAIAEKITVTFTGTGATFNVSGQTSGLLGSGSVNVKFSNKIQFILIPGTTPWAVNSTIVFDVVQKGFVNSGDERALIVEEGGTLILQSETPLFLRTRVNNHISANQQNITLADAVNWNKNDWCVIGPTDFYDASNGAGTPEKLLANNISSTTLTLRAPLTKKKWGKLQYPTDSGVSLTPGTLTNSLGSSIEAWNNIPKVIDQRAPVINLTRGIVIQGRDDDVWNISRLGGHAMFMGRNSTIKIDGVEFRRMGQAGVIGRYPIHFHMMSYNMPDGMILPSDGTFLGLATGQYIKNCSIHQSAQRAIVIHGTHGLDILRNVCYDITAHAIFLEDGSEKSNTIKDNVVIKVKAPTTQNQLLVHDNGSGIWYSNPANILEGNWVSGCEGIGIWNAFANRCFGLSYDVQENPQDTLVTLHRYNVTHSHNMQGMVTEFPPVNNLGRTVAASHNAASMDITGAEVWKNKIGGYQNRVRMSNYLNWMQSDNEAQCFFGAVQIGSVIKSTLLVGESLNNEVSRYISTYGSGMSSYHELLTPSDCLIVNMPFYPNDGVNTGAYGCNNPSMQGAGFLRMTDLYTQAITSFARNGVFSGLKMVNSYFGYRAKPPYYDGQSMDSPTPSNPNAKRNWGFSTAVIDKCNLFNNGTDKTYIFDLPSNQFFTFNAANLVPEPSSGPYIGANGQRTTSRYIGILPECILGLPANPTVDITNYEMTIERFNGSTSVGTYYIGPGNQASQLGIMKHWSAQVGGKYVMKFGTALPTVYFTMIITYAENSSDVTYIAIPWNGSTPVSTVTITKGSYGPFARTPTAGEVQQGQARYLNNTGMTSESSLTSDVSGDKFWQDTANNLVWVQVRNNLTQSSRALGEAILCVNA